MQYFLIGYYGFGNAGDNWCLHQTMRLIKTQDKQALFKILWRTTPAISEPNKVSRTHITSVWRALRSSDKCIFGGGGLLQNKTSRLSLLYYLGLLILAKCIRKPCYFIGQGVGPIHGKFWRWLTKRGVYHVKKATVRDKESLLLMPEARTRQSVDLSFWKASLYQSDTPKDIRIGVSFCSDKLTGSIFKAVLSTIQNQAKEVVPYAFFPDQDTPLLNSIGVKNEDIVSMEDAFFNLKKEQLTVMVAMRYHACVWAALNGIPFLAIAYDPKVTFLAEAFQQPVFNVYKEPFMIDRFNVVLKNMISQQPMFKLLVEDIAANYRKMAHHHEWVITHD